MSEVNWKEISTCKYDIFGHRKSYKVKIIWARRLHSQ